MSVSIVWRRLDRPGHDCCTLRRFREAWLLEGGAVWHDEVGPARLSYRLRCDSQWQARSAQICGRVGQRVIDLMVVRGHDGTWGINGQELPESGDMVDIDLGFSPAGRVLMMRRILSESRSEIQQDCVWIDGTTWQPGLCQQSYRHIENGRWEFRSEADDPARLTVDSYGFITDHPERWVKEG